MEFKMVMKQELTVEVHLVHHVKQEVTQYYMKVSLKLDGMDGKTEEAIVSVTQDHVLTKDRTLSVYVTTQELHQQ
jgi:hypothetical protein